MRPRRWSHNELSVYDAPANRCATLGVSCSRGNVSPFALCVASCAALVFLLIVAVCPYSAHADDTVKTCPTCAGSGWVRCFSPCEVCGGDGDVDGHKCETCGGTGIHEYLEHCPNCGGVGTVEASPSALDAAALDALSYDDASLQETIRHLENKVTSYQNLLIVLFAIYCGIMCAAVFWTKVQRHD